MLEEIKEKRETSGMNDRARERYLKTKETVFDEGYRHKEIVEKSENGYGDFDSFFSVLVDCKLAGEEYPLAQEIFENMKKQINHYRAEVNKYSEEYFKLQNENRALKIEYYELLREDKSE